MSLFSADSTQTLDFTFHESKLTCWKPFYTAHIVSVYFIFFSGVFAFITRLHRKLHPLHHWMGKLYVMSMLWGTATSLLIHNTGLPIGVLYSFLWVLSGLCFGWAAITIHVRGVPYVARKRPELKTQTKLNLLKSRMLSFKSLHGCFMFVSWINIAGRIFVTPLGSNFECYTHAAYKHVSGSKHFNFTLGVDDMSKVKFVEQNSPDYARFPWAFGETRWAVMMLFAPLAGAFLVGCAYVLATVKVKRVDPRTAGAE